jgi:aminoglycoside 3-N-acetyltransferase
MKKILAHFPQIEAILRNVYWRSAFIINILEKFSSLQPRNLEFSKFSIDDLIILLKNKGVNPNDIVVIHSSMKSISACGLGPKEVINKLMHDLIPYGTLVCPTFPIYPFEPKGKDRFTKDVSDIEFIYNVQKSRPWTGDLGRALMKMPGARRSIHPLNTITAYGASVDQIFEKESIETLDLPCGLNSTWAALSKLNAKIVMLGVDMTHSLTMIHVAEDCSEKQWPVKGWYRQRHFRIIDGGQENSVQVRERHPRWALSYAERKLSRDLYDSGIATLEQIGSMEVTVLESKPLLDFLDNRKQSAYPYYLTWLSSL